MQQMNKVLEVNKLKKYFPSQKRIFGENTYVKAVDGISFDIYKGETLSLVGESGCGKSTTGRALLGLIEATEGEIIFKGTNLLDLSKSEMKLRRKSIQMVFQDPYSSLKPRKQIGKTLEESLKIHNVKDRREKVLEILGKVGLQREHYYKYPHEFSGGQRQRIGLARALIIDPEVVICDEPVSALDVSIQSQIINLLEDLQKELDLTYLFISHDLSVVRHISDRVIVMYLGKIVEQGEAEHLFNAPKHPYTQFLIESIPKPNPKLKKEREILKGEVPSPIDPPTGCVFHPRCPFVK